MVEKLTEICTELVNIYVVDSRPFKSSSGSI